MTRAAASVKKKTAKHRRRYGFGDHLLDIETNAEDFLLKRGIVIDSKKYCAYRAALRGKQLSETVDAEFCHPLKQGWIGPPLPEHFPPYAKEYPILCAVFVYEASRIAAKHFEELAGAVGSGATLEKIVSLALLAGELYRFSYAFNVPEIKRKAITDETRNAAARKGLRNLEVVEREANPTLPIRGVRDR